MLTHIGGMLGFLATEMRFEYLAPVYAGDTITCLVTVLEKEETQRRMKCSADFTNQDDVSVLHANFSGFPGQVRLSK